MPSAILIHPAVWPELTWAKNCVGLCLLANVNSRSRSLYAIARPSVVCRLSVTLVRPTQAVQILGNISKVLGTLAIH